MRWSVWELALLTISLVLIASPLLAAGYALIEPTAAPAAPMAIVFPTSVSTPCPGGPCDPPTFTPEPAATNTPTSTSVPTATATNTPDPNATPTSTTEPCGSGYPGPCDPCAGSGYPDPNPTPCGTATPTLTPTPTETATPTETTLPTETATATATTVPATAEPTATTAPRTLAVVKTALGLNGQGIAYATPGSQFLYSFRVDNGVTPAVPVELSDTFPAGIDGVAVLSVENGTCSITARALNCTLMPTQGKSATVMIKVVVTATDGTTIANTATAVNTSTGETVSGAAGTVLIGGGPEPIPTGAPTQPAPTSAPTQPAPTSAPTQPAPTGQPTTPQPTAVPAAPQPTAVPAAPQPNRPSNPQPSNPQPSNPQPSNPDPATPEPATPAPATAEPTAVPAPATSEPATPAPATPAPATPEPATPAPATPAPAQPGAPRPTATPKPRPAGAAPTKPPVRQAAPTKTPAPTNTPAPTATPGPTMAPVTTPAPNVPAMRFNLNSDWGQVFVGDTFEYEITLQNAGAGAGGTSPFAPRARKQSQEKLLDIPAVEDVVIADDLNPLFEIVEAKASGMQVKVVDQRVEATRATLAGGETVSLRIKVRARPVDVSGKMILNQATLRYKGVSDTLFSNIVAVKVVMKAAPTATARPTDVPTPTVAVPTATPEPTIQEFGTQADLPHTSGGAPLFGVVLLGLTMLLHSVRVHRSRFRI